ncbi:FAD-binding domain-containing protein [Mycena belliarum]|uniref:FAD-binding domain-containing protein n=1 Tax=Mycena belliarum TaxID=1033014 RepID=A0AAD6XWG9_9AGAR|nr:FAD-binding domain-containing protein [Mycena belliae]
MARCLRPLCAVLALASSALALSNICANIEKLISPESAVYYSSHYAADLAHWGTSSSQVAACAVEPGTAVDVSKILKLLGRTRTPFAVRGAGHTMNQGWSSTTGVQIAMTRFAGVQYSAGSQTVDVGAGLHWDDVYAALAPFGVNVVGGRANGVGVAGFTLGGGYSYKTSQYGLTLDTVVAYELVKPNGVICNVTADSDPDLFFGLKGGLNNFGIVTRFTLKTHPQGGLIAYAGQEPAVSAAVAKFSATATDPKAAILPSYNFVQGQACTSRSLVISHFMFYDGPTPPPGLFDDFLAIPNLVKDVSTRTFLSLVQSGHTETYAGSRGAFHSICLLQYTPTMMAAIVNETNFWGAKLASSGASFISYDIEPFLPSLYTHNLAGAPTAFPFARTEGFLPLNLYYAWAPGGAASAPDGVFHAAMKASGAHLLRVAAAEGQDVARAPLYPNYILGDTPLERVYGPNLPRLRAIQRRVDPRGVMRLAGGLKL